MIITNFKPFPFLRTERLFLRDVVPGDVNEVFYLRSNPAVLHYINRVPASSPDEAAEFITMINEQENKGGSVTWAITLKESPDLIGMIAIWNVSIQHHRAELGYVLHPKFQGKGIMQEALVPVVEYGFKTINLHTLHAELNPENRPSIRLLERNGFVQEAYFREDFFFEGKYLDSAVFSRINPYHK